MFVFSFLRCYTIYYSLNYDFVFCKHPYWYEPFGIDLVHIHGSYSLKEFDGHRVIVAVTNDVELKANGQTFTLVQGHSALIPASCKDLEMVATDCSVTIGIPYIA